MSNFRVMLYNIYLGGKDKRFGNRLDKICDIIKECQPDILTIIEAVGFDHDGQELLFTFEQSLQMRGVLAQASSGWPVALFVKPKHFITKSFTDDENFFHVTLITKLLLNGEFPLTTISTHLNPFSPDARVIEAQYLAYRVSESEHTLLMGDFNSLSPDDEVPPHLLDELPAHKRAFHGMDEIDFRPMRIVYKAGFVDLYKQKNDDPGYTAPTGLSRDNKTPPLRIDYILGSPKISKYFLSCEVIRNETAEKASDHYPLQANFDLPSPREV